MKDEQMASARYDSVADWYDQQVAWSTAAAAPLIARLAGRGSGWCLDVGCGTGVHLAALAEAGWSVVGVDASADQLRMARRRAGPGVAGLVQADAARLPFPSGSCPLVVSAFTHTDVEDFTSLVREARRILEVAASSTSASIRALLAPLPSSHERMVPAWSIRDMGGPAGRPTARGRSQAV
jgi:ubiquinone/menaquinone biosynthesis C-methylase UbiE